MKIRILSNELASRIAAGEVVERPASVVKELIENALDAGATDISIALEKSGTSLIRVTDNGAGMVPEDLELAAERHATSKLKEEADLCRIRTLGFRGEALPSIGSVSRMEIVSRPPAAASAYRVCIQGGAKEPCRPSAAAIGTTIEVRDLFFNTPARRKFLKSPATELSHICDTVNRTALAFSDVHFRLQHDGRTIADYVAVAQVRDRLQQVLGRDIAARLTPLGHDAGPITIMGHASTVPLSFPNARYLYTFVNRRYVRDKVLSHAVLLGYQSLLMKGQYPVAIVFVDVPFEEVDVNVHPAKYEVRFRRQADVHSAVSAALRAALQREAKTPARTAAPPPFGLIRDRPLPYAAPPSTGCADNRTAEVFKVNQATPTTPSGFFSSMEILGQVFESYVVCASPSGLALIDQHAAHERVVFEKLRRQLEAGRVEGQTLLIPQTLELSAGEMMLIADNRDLIERFGFSLEPFGPGAYAIRAAPALLPAGDYAEIVRQMIGELADVNTTTKLRQRLEDRLATMACHSVIRAHRKLDLHEIRALLEALDATEFATQCPHGRPVLVEWSQEALERIFKRVV